MDISNTLCNVAVNKFFKMIDARDVRVNNWFEWKDNGQKFQATVGILVNTSFWKHIEQGDIIHIPLTKEIFLKCGFKVNIGTLADTNAVYFDICNLKYRIYTSDDYTSIHFNAVDWFPEIIKLTSLHQLQNLYYALTQTELQIKL